MDKCNIVDASLKWRFAAFAIALGSLAIGFHTLLFTRLPGLFQDELEDMSFGWYVPVFSLYVVYIERKKIFDSIGAPSWGGLAAMVPFLALGFLGVRGLQIRFEIVALVFLLLTSVWALFGRRTAKAVLFPCLFLLFLIPLNTFLDVVTVHLRLFTTGTAYAIMKAIGAEVYRSGTMIQGANGFQIDVAAPCSGLRSIFALMALTAGYAYLSQKTWLKRALLFSTSVPLAILGNVMRILTICLVANYCSPDFALGFYHDYSGYVVFLVAIALMLALGGAIESLKIGNSETPPADAPSAPTTATSTTTSTPRPHFFLFHFSFFLLLLLPVMLFQSVTMEPVLTEAPPVSLREVEGYESTEIAMSEAELNVLPEDTKMLKRIYTDSEGEWFQVSVVIGGRSKSSIHRPELCLPSQGFQMTKPRTVKVDGGAWRFITLEKGDSRPLGFAYTFFNQESFRTCSHTARILVDIFDRSILNRIDRWVMITVNSSTADDEKIKAFIESEKGPIAK